MFVCEVCIIKKNKSTEIFPRLLLKTYAHVNAESKKGQQRFQF